MGLSLDAFKTQEVTVVRCRGRIVFGKEADELRRILQLAERKQAHCVGSWLGGIR